MTDPTVPNQPHDPLDGSDRAEREREDREERDDEEFLRDAAAEETDDDGTQVGSADVDADRERASGGC